MSIFLTALLTSSLTMSAIILLVMLMNKVLANKVRAAHRYYLWLIVLIGLLIPFRPSVPIPFAPVEIAIFETQQQPPYVSAVVSETADVASAVEKPPVPYTLIIFGIWIIGALAVLAVHLRSYSKFTSSVHRWGVDVTDKQVLSVFQHVMNDIGLKDRLIQVKTCIFVSSPLLIGFRTPIILLPEKEISLDELEHIFKHELTHYKHRDLWMNLLVLLVRAIHWFNPIVYLMAKVIRTDCEAACDEAVCTGSGTDKRKHYGEAIIGFIGTEADMAPVLSTYFYGSSKNMKKRLSSIMDTSRKGKGLASICGTLIIMATLLTGTVFAAATTSNTSQYIGEAKAKAIALEHAGISESQVTFVKTHLDYDDGRVVYDIEFYSGNTEYDYEIDAVNGNVLAYDREIEYYTIPSSSADGSSATGKSSEQISSSSTGQYIGETKAKSIALSAAGISESQASRMKVKLEREDGTMVYEVDFNYGRTEYEYEIDAVSGAILKADVDYDD